MKFSIAVGLLFALSIRITEQKSPILQQDAIPLLDKMAQLTLEKLENVIDKIDLAPYVSILEDLEDIVETLRDAVRNGSESLGIPQLDPLSIEHTDLDMDNEIVVMTGTLDDVNVVDLANFNVTYADLAISGLIITMNVVIPDLQITGAYDIYGELAELFMIFGKGPLSIKINDIEVGITTQAYGTMVDGQNQLSLHFLNISLSVGSAEVNFENFLEDPELTDVFNTLFNEFVPEAVEYIWVEIEPDVSAIILERINQFLADESISEDGLIKIFQKEKA